MNEKSLLQISSKNMTCIDFADTFLYIPGIIGQLRADALKIRESA